MKKILMIIIAFLTFGCAPIPKQDIHGLVEIDYEKLDALMGEKTQFIIYFGRPDCGDCQGFAPVLDDYLTSHQDAGLYYLNLKRYRDAAKKEGASQADIDFYQQIFDRFALSWTPTLEVIANGRIKRSYQYLDEDYYTITDRQEQIARRQAFISEFYTFMDQY